MHYHRNQRDWHECFAEEVQRCSVYKRRDNVVDDCVGFRLHLCVGRVLNRMRYEDAPDFRKAEIFRLNLGRANECRRRDEHCRLALDFEVNRVVHTARRT